MVAVAILNSSHQMGKWCHGERGRHDRGAFTELNAIRRAAGGVRPVGLIQTSAAQFGSENAGIPSRLKGAKHVYPNWMAVVSELSGTILRRGRDSGGLLRPERARRPCQQKVPHAVR